MAEELTAIPGVLEAYATTGTSDVLCRVAAASHQDLQETLLALNRSVTVVRSTSTIVLSVVVAPPAAAARRGPAPGAQPRARLPDRRQCTMTLTSLDAARAAAARVGVRVTRTALVPAPALSRRLGAEVWLKRELDQRTGSFKVRGVFNAALSMPADVLGRGLIGFSAGNHAAAVAYVGGILGVPVTVCMPAHAVARKIDATRALGAEVILVESDLVGTALRVQAERGLTLVHPFDDAAIVAGHAGVGLEIMADLSEVDLVVVPVGGGGLISGIAAAVKQLRPAARVIGVEPETADVVSRSLLAGSPQSMTPASIADGLTAPITGAVPFAHIRGPLWTALSGYRTR